MDRGFNTCSKIEMFVQNILFKNNDYNTNERKKNKMENPRIHLIKLAF